MGTNKNDAPRAQGKNNVHNALAGVQSRFLPSLQRHSRFVIAGAVAIALVAGFTIWMYLAQFSLVRVDLAGTTISSRQQLSDATNNYQWAVQWPDKSLKKFKLAGSGIEVDIDHSVSEASQARLSKNPLRRLMWWKHISVPLSLRVDETKLNQFIRQNLTIATKQPQNAVIGIANGQTTITPEQTGEGYTLPAESLKKAAVSLESAPLLLTAQKLTPSLTTDILKPSREKLETVLAQKITFTLGDNVFQPKRSDIGAWLELTPVPQERITDITVNSGKISAYMLEVSRTYSQVPRSQVVTPASMGNQILIPGKNGVELINREQAAASVATKLLDGKGLDVALSVQSRNFSTVVAQPQDKWIIVDTTSKRLYAYEQTTPVKTMLVTAGAPQTPTVIGTFKIYRKVRKQDMRGSNADGSRYFQPNVEWVNYFFADYAIHGNYWRPSSYFGNINSSHGCVGITNSEAAWLYTWATEGTTVIVHK